MKKLPKIYQNEINKIKNNKEVFDSLKNDDFEFEKNINLENKDDKFINLTVKEKIKELINQNSYIFNTKVILVLENREVVCQIAGVVNNHIITMDNEIIKIDDLKDLKVLKK